MNLSRNQLCGIDEYGGGTFTAEGITAIADALNVTASITSIGEGGLDLRGNTIGGAGCAAIIAAVCSNKDSKIHSINFSDAWSIGPEDAKVIGEALRTSVTASLTSVR